MPGLYLHIPFCRKACNYCNFHFSTSTRGHQEMVDALVQELTLRRDELAGAAWQTVYFGGGTPSLLSPKQVNALLDAADRIKAIPEGTELTLEANPDDLTPEVVEQLASTRINRLSIGVQSFRERDLRYMNRAHDAAQATACLVLAQAAGFSDLTLDLIYGTPGLSDADWRKNLEIAIGYGIPHLSAYALTVEPQTALAHQIKTGKSQPVDEAHAARQMEILVDTLTDAGYEHYEISNFALPGRRAKHNSNYWLGAPYLGIGPSAHSFDGANTRSWNVANNAQYVRAIHNHELPQQSEQLSERDRYHELILTRLRTTWGVTLKEVERLGFAAHFRAQIAWPVAQGLIELEDDTYRLTRAGRLLADGVSADLFLD